MLLTGVAPRRRGLTHFMDDAELGSDLVSYHAMDDATTSKVVIDSVGFATGTAYANTSTFSCTGPTSLITKGFNWTNTLYGFTADIDEPSASILCIGKAFSFNQWVYIPSFPQSSQNYQSFFGNLNGYRGLICMTNSQGLWHSFGDNAGKYSRLIVPAAKEHTGVWSMISFSYDGRTATEPNGGMKAYVNGSIITSPTLMNGPCSATITPGTTTNIGRANGNYGGWIGKQAALAVWSKEISAAGFAKMYNSGDGLPY